MIGSQSQAGIAALAALLHGRSVHIPAATLTPNTSKPKTTEIPTKIATDRTAICTNCTGVGLVTR
jgi:hypothetical protein